MNRNQCHSKCECLRYRALRDGEGSRAYSAWRTHSMECQECRATLHILELLKNRDDAEKCRLNPEDAARLFERAKEHYSSARPRRGFLATAVGVLWKSAVVASVMVVSCKFSALDRVLDHGVSAMASAALAIMPSHRPGTGLAHAFDPAAQLDNDSLEAMLLQASPAEAAFMPEVLPGDGFDHCLRKLGDHMDEQAEKLRDIVKGDFNLNP